MNLKPCPFCGSSDIDESFSRGYDGENRDVSIVGAGCNSCGSAGAMVRDFEGVGYEESSEAWNRRASQWTRVEDKSPEGLCLVMCGGEMHTATYHKNITIIGGHFEFDREPVTHWTPLPEKPEKPK